MVDQAATIERVKGVPRLRTSTRSNGESVRYKRILKVVLCRCLLQNSYHCNFCQLLPSRSHWLTTAQDEIEQNKHVTYANSRLYSSRDLSKFRDTATMERSVDEPFRFMDLPKELRLMVYECLLTHSRHEIVFRDDPSTTKHSRLTIVLRDAIPPIHHTCRELHIEVVSLLKPKIDKLPPIPHIFAEVSDSRMSSLFLGIEQILRIIALSRERDCQTTEEIQHLFEEDTYPQPWYCAIDIRAAIDIQAVTRFIKMAARRIAVDTGPSDSTTEIAHLLHIAMNGTKNNALRWIWFHEIMMMACEIHMVPCA
jgi:hypothetical protein